eukprot:SAG25_NODE_6168_length_582_cov_1.453416_2_plen_94_part_01
MAKNSVVGGMVAKGSIDALAAVGEGALSWLGPLLAEKDTVELPSTQESDVATDIDAIAEMRRTNLELHRAIQADMRTFITNNRGGTLQQWAVIS